eukprot:GHVT01100302.1.p1 GENE.GHVT01100302.1~~GHVT01100302.1.p1  ORF type:complete len:202 (-),score=36.84 GHVT01100302.1:587-1192(-)
MGIIEHVLSRKKYSTSNSTLSSFSSFLFLSLDCFTPSLLPCFIPSGSRSPPRTVGRLRFLIVPPSFPLGPAPSLAAGLGNFPTRSYVQALLTFTSFPLPHSPPFPFLFPSSPPPPPPSSFPFLLFQAHPRGAVWGGGSRLWRYLVGITEWPQEFGSCGVCTPAGLVRSRAAPEKEKQPRAEGWGGEGKERPTKTEAMEERT